MQRIFRNKQSDGRHFIDLLNSIDKSACGMRDMAGAYGTKGDKERVRDTLDRVILVIIGEREIEAMTTHSGWSAKILKAWIDKLDDGVGWGLIPPGTPLEETVRIDELQRSIYQAAAEFRSEFHGSEGLRKTLMKALRNLGSIRGSQALGNAVMQVVRDLGSHGAAKNSVENSLNEVIQHLGIYVAELKIAD